ncbi:hypothetical protein M0657_005269 [Pyricularia oryzae]|nr:hypothetical protein M0657_005269 [Pyricularia oryzae]KAI7926069.1 hypothetical protein M9X92_003025 [Pyricularia oryzae]
MKSSIDGWALTVCTPAWVWDIGIGIDIVQELETSKSWVWSVAMAKQGRKGRHLALGPRHANRTRPRATTAQDNLPGLSLLQAKDCYFGPSRLRLKGPHVTHVNSPQANRVLAEM